MGRTAIVLMIVLGLAVTLQADDEANKASLFGLRSAECYEALSPARHQKAQAECMLARHDEVVFQLFSYFKKGDAVLTYFDPVGCPEVEEAPPFEITSVTFTLAHP